MKLLILICFINLLFNAARFLRAVWKWLTIGTFPRVKWDDGKVKWRLSHTDTGASYRVLLNLQTPARRREERERHAEWVERMRADYNMDFSHTLPS